MPRISDNEIERIKREVDLVALVRSSGVGLKQQGESWIGHCPFHDDKTPSLVVTPKKNLWNCLGKCGEGGGVLKWVMQNRGVSFRHAYEILNDGQVSTGMNTGAPLKQSSVPQLQTPVDSQADDSKLLKQVVEYYHKTFKYL